jgi:hypothetical protein
LYSGLLRGIGQAQVGLLKEIGRLERRIIELEQHSESKEP